jgi:hypothetical protein
LIRLGGIVSFNVGIALAIVPRKNKLRKMKFFGKYIGSKNKKNP